MKQTTREEPVKITVLSGLGAKAPAAILIETTKVRLLLDAGGPLDPGTACEWVSDLERRGWPDAILISHDHPDHTGSLAQLPSDIPLYCTSETARALPAGRRWRALASRGEQRIAGVRVTTGQAGHSLDGVWLHLALGQGIFYSGDTCLESAVFPFDPPPTAAIALLDTSYGRYDQSLAAAQAAMTDHLKHPTVMPVPASGRAAEIALWFIDNSESTHVGDENLTRLALDEGCHQALARLLALPDTLRRPGIDARLRELLTVPPSATPHLLLVDDDGLRNTWPGFHTLHSGYLTPSRRRQVAAGEATWQRWNVHPRLTDITTLMNLLQAQELWPLFTELTPEWQRDFPLSPPAQKLAMVTPTRALHPTSEVCNAAG
ncbi:MBL fold metallo-hydrolase [Halomonas halocynthiae]|uniref:MBL fold metallo-hydrolase n=1 Tax=Halomonas halocynthiae TaxID=176290 RepID=UPI00041EA9C6|nr:MBL fold metallo-hydrolase [Halomonas halocynthiae]